MRISAIGEQLRRWAGSGRGQRMFVASEFTDRLAKVLEEMCQVGPEALSQARALIQQTGRSLGETLVDMGILLDEQLYAAYSEVTGLPLWQGRGEIVEDTTFPTDFLVYNRVLPVSMDGETWLVIANPEDDGLIDMLRRLAPGSRIAIHPEDEIAYRLERHFELSRETLEEEPADTVADVEHLKDLALEVPIIREVNNMVMAGIKMGASDIHLEPFRDLIELRYRVDGVLHNRPAPSLEDYPAVISRVKILAELDIAERRLPQDGRYMMRAAGQEVDIRVSTVPTPFGEDVALRLLNQKKQLLSIDALGLSPEVMQAFRDVLHRSHGLMLVTGPTGSGKTTSLYAGLKDIIDGEKKIITVEDPVEYEVAGVSQIQAHSEIGLTFASTLRSILRHDPDVILVGEIRDRETAEIAVQAALTGHLVLSTVHTNDAVSSIGRMLNLGVADYMLASGLIAVTGQRLVRRLCPECRRQRPVEPALAERFAIDRDVTVYEAVGCVECDGNGYSGRLPIAEFLTIDAEIRELILARPTSDALLEKARQHGFRSMLDDGVAKVVAGLTSFDEVLRVVG